jgi:multidrug efflux system membrane fusion protein
MTPPKKATGVQRSSKTINTPLSMATDHIQRAFNQAEEKKVTSTAGFARVFGATFHVILPFLLLGVAIAAYFQLQQSKPVNPTSVPRENVVVVETIPVILKSHQPMLTLYGTTVSGREVELRALVAGRVKTTQSQLMTGGVIDAGRELLQIDPFGYEKELVEAKAQLLEASAKLEEIEASLRVEQASLASAREQRALAKRDLERAQKLASRGTISEKKLDDRKLTTVQRSQSVSQSEKTLAVWSARRKQQQATIARLEATVARAEQKLSDTSLKAPFDAYVTDVGAQVGRMLGVNDRVASLIDRNWIEVRFSLTDAQFGRLTMSSESLIGRIVSIRWRTGDDHIFYAASVDRIDARADTENGGIFVFARIKQPLRPVAIRPGIFVDVELPDVKVTDATRVPSQAVYNGTRVYVVADGRLASRKVRVVGVDGSSRILKGQLRQGEKIVITRLPRPEEGIRIKEIDSISASQVGMDPKQPKSYGNWN